MSDRLEPDPPPGGPVAPGRAPAPAIPWIRVALAVLAVGLFAVTPPDASLVGYRVGAAALLLLVAAWPGPASAPARPSRVVLFVGGVFALLGPLCYVNPWFGIDSTDWLWTYWSQSRAWPKRLDVALWIVGAVLAIVAAASRRRVLAAITLTLTVLLAARAHAKFGALALVQLQRVNLIWTLSAGAVGAGLLHLTSAHAHGRTTARLLAIAGVLGIASVYAGWFPEQGAGEHGSLYYYARELPVIFGGAFGGTELDERYVGILGRQSWGLGVPFLLQLVAVAVAVVLALVPSRHAGRPVRWLAAAGLIALLGTWVVPAWAKLWYLHQDFGTIPAARGGNEVGEALMKAGLSVWLCLTGAVATLLGAAGARPADPTPPLPMRTPSRGAGRVALYATSVVLGLAVLRTAFDPERGLIVRARLADVVALASWVEPFAVFAFLAGFTLVAIACAFLPSGRRRGGLGLIAALLFLGVFSPSDQRWFGDVEAYVAPALGAIAAGACAGRSRAARGIAVGAAFCLAALLLYPRDLPPVIRPDGRLITPFSTVLVDDAIRPLLASETWDDAVRALGNPQRAVAVAFALTAVLAALAAAARSRWIAGATVVVFLVGGVVGPLVLHVLGYGGGGFPEDWSQALWRAAASIRFGALVAIPALLAGAADLALAAPRATPALPDTSAHRGEDGGVARG